VVRRRIRSVRARLLAPHAEGEPETDLEQATASARDRGTQPGTD
jgi:hypothetical protein